MDEEIISWTDHEFDEVKKPAGWYGMVLLAGLLLGTLSFFFGSTLFTVFIALSIFVFFLLGARKPKHFSYSITKRGVVVGKSLYSYDSLHSFWIREEEEGDKLVIKQDVLFSPYMIIPLRKTQTEHVREVLAEKIPEVPHEKDFSEVISEYIRF